ncbi:MAG: Sigma factor sigB regulation protein rsbU [Paenibacillaceae bacterium]|nr:Sigma factor sigB regulation protein rsbU [Paenibacillaceae bacterium]
MRIVIVDDNPINQMIIGKILEDAGYRKCVTLNSAKALFAYLGMERPGGEYEEGNPDLILMDMMMPEIDGIEACRRLQEVDRLRDIPIIIVTALNDSLKLAEALDMGATDYVTKPINKVELLARIRLALRLRSELHWHKAKERDMSLELALAKQVQETVLSKPLVEENLRIEAVYMPSKMLAGDFYAWHPLGQGRYGVIILDMMGHGISSSLMCMYIASALQGALMRNPDPAEVIKVLNEYMVHLHNKEKWVRYYFTAIYFILDPVNRTIEYVNAGHPPGLIMIDGKELKRLSAGTCAVGFDDPIEVSKGIITYEHHVKMLLFTDGLLELCSADWDTATDTIEANMRDKPDISLEEHIGLLTNAEGMAGSRDDFCMVAIEAGSRCGSRGNGGRT